MRAKKLCKQCSLSLGYCTIIKIILTPEGAERVNPSLLFHCTLLTNYGPHRSVRQSVFLY